MNILKKSIYLFLLIALFSSCKTTKSIANKKNNMLLNSVLDKYHATSFNQKTVKASLKLKYKGQKSLPTINVSLRIEKDTIIWLSLSKFISIGKLKITPNRVQYYNKLDKTYFDGDFSLLSNLLGTEVNFKQVQNIFLGEAIYPLNSIDFQIKQEETSFVFTPKNNDERFNIFFWLDKQSFKTTKQEIRQNNDEKLLSIQCTEFETISSKLFPKHVYILAKNKETKTTIDIDYKSVAFNLPLRFPFTIPNGYKEIQIK